MSENINFDTDSIYDLVLDREYKNNIPQRIEKFTPDKSDSNMGIIICIIIIIIVVLILVNM